MSNLLSFSDWALDSKFKIIALRISFLSHCLLFYFQSQLYLANPLKRLVDTHFGTVDMEVNEIDIIFDVVT